MPPVHQSRPGGAAFQIAEHVQQRRGHRGWRRDRPRPGAAGAGLPHQGQRAHEPGAAETAKRDRRAAHRARPHGRQPECRLLSAAQGRTARYLPGELPPSGSRMRPRSGRRRRQPGRDQSAARRHRQYGLCPRRQCPRRAHRRHRSRACHRRSGRRACGAGRRRPRDDQGLPHQQIPRRPGFVRRRPHRDHAPHRLAGFRHGPLFIRRPPLARRRRGRPGPPSRDRRRAAQNHRRAAPLAHRQFRRFRSAAA